jgi:hypothetical protein
MDSRLRRCPPDRAHAASYGQAGENALRLPPLAHRSAAVPKLHRASTGARIAFDSGNGETFNRQPALAYSSRNLSKQPAPSQTVRASLTSIKRHPELPPWRHEELTPCLMFLGSAWWAVSPSRPECCAASCAAAVKHGRRSPPKAARAGAHRASAMGARSVLDGGEHGVRF